MTDSGYLALIGGAEEKKNGMLVLKTLVKILKIKKMAIIPTATDYPVALSEEYSKIFKKLNVKDIEIFDIRKSKDSDLYINFLNKIDSVFFTGGDQLRLVNALENTEFLHKLKERFFNGLNVIGTSAGSAVVSKKMIYETSFKKGFGFIDITIDTHFSSRDRTERLLKFDKGIGIDEDTAIILKDNIFEVIGNGKVTIIRNDDIKYAYHPDKFDIKNFKLI